MSEKINRRFMPSNGTEGDLFTGEFCEHCINEEFMSKNYGKQCEILNNSLLHDRPCYNKDLKYDGWEWFDNGDFDNYEWKCNQYKHWDWGNDRRGWNEPSEPPPYDPNQLILFSFDEGIDNLIKEQKQIFEEV